MASLLPCPGCGSDNIGYDKETACYYCRECEAAINTLVALSKRVPAAAAWNQHAAEVEEERHAKSP